MAYVKVRLVVGGQTYNAEIDETADPAALLRSFAKQLPKLADSNYRIALVDTVKIREGSTIELVRVEPPEPARIL